MLARLGFLPMQRLGWRAIAALPATFLAACIWEAVQLPMLPRRPRRPRRRLPRLPRPRLHRPRLRRATPTVLEHAVALLSIEAAVATAQHPTAVASAVGMEIPAGL